MLPKSHIPKHTRKANSIVSTQSIILRVTTSHSTSATPQTSNTLTPRLSTPSPSASTQNGEPEAAGAQQALGQLLGQALNLLPLQGTGGATAATATISTSQHANGSEQHLDAATSSSGSSSVAPRGYPDGSATMASSAEVVVEAVPAPVAEAPEPPAKVIEYKKENEAHVPTGPQKLAKTANGTSNGGGVYGGGEVIAVTGLVGERIRQFAKAAEGAATADHGTPTTADISASSSPVVDGVGGTSAKTWSAATAELVEANARLAEKAE